MPVKQADLVCGAITQWGLLFAFCLMLGAAGIPSSAAGKSYPCYWVTGRLQPYNGNPTYRIWPRGTNRLLGVVARDDSVMKEEDRLPPSLRKLSPRFGRQFWGKFRFCPVSPERAGWMRLGYLTAARDVTVVDD